MISKRKTTLDSQYTQARHEGTGIPVTQSAEPALGLIIGMAQHVKAEDNIKLYHLCVIDLDDKERSCTFIPMSFFGHGFTPDPVNPERACVFEKRGKGACEIDLKTGSVTREITGHEDREFYGHGAYSPDGKLLYSTETIVSGHYEGVIAIRDAKTHAYLGDFPSFGASPHDCRLIDDGKTMVVTNGGGPLDGIAPNVSYIDVETEQLIEKLEFDNAQVNAGHLDISSTGKLAVVSAQREGLPIKSPGGISLRLHANSLNTLSNPAKLTERLYDESLSVCIHEKNNIVGATTPTGNLVTFWNIDNGELLHYIVVPNPRGIELTQDKKYFVVSYGQGNPDEAISLFSADTLEQIKGYDLTHTGITGSHLTSYSLPKNLRQ